MMRVDILLNKLCLVKTRSIAKKACDLQLVKINGKLAKASSEVKADDLVNYELSGYKTEIKIIEIPRGNVSKKNAAQFYELICREKLTLEG